MMLWKKQLCTRGGREGHANIKDDPWTAWFDKRLRKVLLKVLFDYEVVIYIKFSPEGQTVNKNFTSRFLNIYELWSDKNHLENE